MIDLVIDQRPRSLGGGLEVGRVLPFIRRQMVGPCIWNVVSSSKDRLAQAAADWRAGRMKLPDADGAEFIPLPDDSTAPDGDAVTAMR